MDIVACYQTFGQRLDQAVVTQGHVAQNADQRQARARETLRQAELRVAALRQLIARWQAGERDVPALETEAMQALLARLAEAPAVWRVNS